MPRTLITLLLFSIFFLTFVFQASAAEVKRSGGKMQIVSPYLQIECDMESGRVDYKWSSNVSILGSACGVRLKDDNELSSVNYTTHDSSPRDVVSINDKFGKGIQVTVHHRRTGLPELRQRFFVYDKKPFFLVEVQVISQTPISSNYVAPILCDATKLAGAGAHLDTGEKPHTLFVPFDNDAFVRYSSDYASASYEVTAIYDNTSRHGLTFP